MQDILRSGTIRARRGSTFVPAGPPASGSFEPPYYAVNYQYGPLTATTWPVLMVDIGADATRRKAFDEAFIRKRPACSDIVVLVRPGLSRGCCPSSR